MFKIFLRRYFPLITLVLVNLIVGLYMLPGFGESIDEISQNAYAERTINAVQSFAAHGFMPASFIDEPPKQGSHGPVFIVLVTLLRRFFLSTGSDIAKLYFDHFIYFLAFQIGVVSIFFLARRWLSETAALGATVLFNTQPILLGHAFMNPKDTVFMSLLTASAVVGFWMVDRGAKRLKAPGHPLTDGIQSFLREFLSGDVWLAGLVLGFASAVRVAAPLVAMVIFAHILVARKWQVLPKFLAYGLIAFCFMILFWPYLWPDPFTRLLGSVSDSANYPDIHMTIFRGALLGADEIPASYLPVLLVVQLTIPTLLLVAVGIFSLIKKVRWDFIALTLIWFLLPAVTVILMQVHVYNNFRQLFFILPPIFIAAGFGLDWLLKFIKRPAIGYLILFLLVFPGLYANIKLYPYQYIYYNELIGGLSGAYRYFELDYWDLAYKDAQLYVNRVAGKNANIFVHDSKYVAQTFARPDLIFNVSGEKDLENYDFIVVSTSANADQQFGAFPTVYIVARDGVPLAYVKRPNPPRH